MKKEILWENNKPYYLDNAVEKIYKTEKSLVVHAVYSCGEKKLFYRLDQELNKLIEQFKVDSNLVTFRHFLGGITPYKIRKWGMVED